MMSTFERHIPVVITDPSPVLRAGLIGELRRAGYQAKATDDAAAIASPDDRRVVLLTVTTRGGMANLAALVRRPKTRIVVLLAAPTDSQCAEALRHGADAVLPRQVAGPQLVAAIAAVATGLKAVTRDLAASVSWGVGGGLTAQEVAVLNNLLRARAGKSDATSNVVDDEVLRSLLTRLSV